MTAQARRLVRQYVREPYLRTAPLLPHLEISLSYIPGIFLLPLYVFRLF